MTWTWQDLVLFSGAVYGIAWIATQSKLMERPRAAVAAVPFVGQLSTCIVCTATWTGLGLMLLLPWTELFSPEFRVRAVLDVPVLLGWTVASSWVLARLLGDAD